MPSTAHRGGPPGTRYSFRRFRTINGVPVRAIAAGYHGHGTSLRGIIAALRGYAMRATVKYSQMGGHCLELICRLSTDTLRENGTEIPLLSRRSVSRTACGSTITAAR